MARSVVMVLVVLVATACGAAQGAMVVPEAAQGILVTGRGETDVAPDLAVVHIGVEARRPTVAEARQDAARAQGGVIDALRAAGVSQEDVRTTQLTISPEYDHTPAGRHLTGYVVRNVVEARLRDVDRVQEAIDTAVAAGGDLTRLDGLRFELSDPARARREARDRAIAEARVDAQQIAAALGAELGEPIAVEEVSADRPGPVAMMRMEAAAPDGTPIEPGTTRVAVEVRVRWAIAR